VDYAAEYLNTVLLLQHRRFIKEGKSISIFGL